MLAHLRLVVYLRGVAGVRGAVELHAGADELRGVLVGRRHVDVEARGRAFHGERAHHVVRLEVVNAHHGDPQRLGELEGVRDGRREVFRHLLPLRLVGRVRAVAERRAAGVHREDGVRRLLALQDRLEPRGEP